MLAVSEHPRGFPTGCSLKKKISRKQALARLQKNLRVLPTPGGRRLPGKLSGPGSATAPDAKDLERANRMSRVLDLRIAGLGVREIARILNISNDTVIRDTQEIFAMTLPDPRKREVYFATEFLRLERLHRNHWIYALGWEESDPKNPEKTIKVPPNIKSAMIVLRASKARREMLGLVNGLSDALPNGGEGPDGPRGIFDGWTEAELESFASSGIVPPGRRLAGNEGA